MPVTLFSALLDGNIVSTSVEFGASLFSVC